MLCNADSMVAFMSVILVLIGRDCPQRAVTPQLSGQWATPAARPQARFARSH
jgi:hypothetical protein